MNTLDVIIGGYNKLGDGTIYNADIPKFDPEHQDKSLIKNKINEMDCSPPSLRGHIVNTHLSALFLDWSGVARYDIELAMYREIPLDWVVEKAYQKIERPDEDIQTEINEEVLNIKKPSEQVHYIHNLEDYKTMIVKNLIYIEQLGRAPIDWDRVNASFPQASNVKLDIDKDTKEGRFPIDLFINM